MRGNLGYQYLDENFDIPDRVVQAQSFEDAMALLYHAGAGIDLCEFCGGEGRPSAIVIRRNLKTGKNFDLVFGIDLGKTADQKKALFYVKHNDVLVIVMAPSCRAMGPPSNVNYRINYDGWHQSYEGDKPHIQFCGEAALSQLNRSRHFIAENRIRPT